jgi:hypothetical protein
MNLPGFTAEVSLKKSTRAYRGTTSYGNPAHGQSGIPANVMPSQYDYSEEMGDADDTGLEAGAEEGDEGLGENGEGDLDGLEDGEASDLMDEGEGGDEEDLG